MSTKKPMLLVIAGQNNKETQGRYINLSERFVGY